MCWVTLGRSFPYSVPQFLHMIFMNLCLLVHMLWLSPKVRGDNVGNRLCEPQVLSHLARCQLSPAPQVPAPLAQCGRCPRSGHGVLNLQREQPSYDHLLISSFIFPVASSQPAQKGIWSVISQMKAKEPGARRQRPRAQPVHVALSNEQ